MPQENSANNFKDKLTNKLQNFFNKPIYDDYHFTLSSNDETNITSSTPEKESEKTFEVKEIFASLPVSLEYIKVKYNALINSDIILREFTLIARNR